MVRLKTLAVIAMMLVACEGDDDSSSSSISSSNETVETSAYSCCYNGAFYECPDQDEMLDCMEGFVSCDRDSSRDDEC